MGDCLECGDTVYGAHVRCMPCVTAIVNEQAERRAYKARYGKRAYKLRYENDGRNKG